MLTRSGSPSKFPQVAQTLRSRIGSGALGTGQRLPTFAEICREFGVTPATASKALQVLENEGLVTREKGRGIFVAAPTVPRRYTIGCYNFGWGADSSPYWIQLLGGIRTVAESRGVDLVVLASHSTRGLEKVDGVLLHGDKGPYPNFPPGVARLSVGEANRGVAGVVADDLEGGRSATRHLLELGHTRIGFLGFPISPVVQIRLAGYRYECLNHGLLVDPAWVRELAGGQTGKRAISRGSDRNWGGGAQSMFELGFNGMQSWWADDSSAGWRQLGCTAILCQNDGVACGAIAALRSLSSSVPGQVSVVGYDDTDEHPQGALGLSTVRVPLERIGARALELLLMQIETNENPVEIVSLPTQFIARGTTGPGPGCRAPVPVMEIP